MTFRFNRDKRSGEFTYAEFMESARKLVEIARAKRSGIKAEILTFESRNLSGKYPKAKFSGDSAMETDDHVAYPIDRFSEDVWERMFDAQVRIEDPNDPEPFFILMTCSRRPKTDRIYFQGNLVDEPLFAEIYGEFTKTSANITIGNEVDRKSNIGVREHRRVA